MVGHRIPKAKLDPLIAHHRACGLTLVQSTELARAQYLKEAFPNYVPGGDREILDALKAEQQKKTGNVEQQTEKGNVEQQTERGNVEQQAEKGKQKEGKENRGEGKKRKLKGVAPSTTRAEDRAAVRPDKRSSKQRSTESVAPADSVKMKEATARAAGRAAGTAAGQPKKEQQQEGVMAKVVASTAVFVTPTIRPVAPSEKHPVETMGGQWPQQAPPDGPECSSRDGQRWA